MSLELPKSGSLLDIAFRKWSEIPDDSPDKNGFARGTGVIIDAVTPLLRRLANEAWMRQDFKTNAKICRLLGEKSALEHERGEDAP